MLTRYRILLLVAIGLCLLGCAAKEQDTEMGYTVVGKLVDSRTGLPIAGIGIQLVGIQQNPDGSTIITTYFGVDGKGNQFSTITDAGGQFAFTGIPPRTYTLAGIDMPPKITRNEPLVFEVEQANVDLGAVEFRKQS